MQNLGDLIRRSERKIELLIRTLKQMPRRHRPLGWHKAAIAWFRMACRGDDLMQTFVSAPASALRSREAGCRDARAAPRFDADECWPTKIENGRDGRRIARGAGRAPALS